jgi:hypothetical protein
MTGSTSPVLAKAREAASTCFGVRSETSLSVAVGDAERGAEAYARVLMEGLLATASAYTEGRGVVAASVVEDLLRELGNE